MIPAITVVPFCLLVPVLLIWLGERHTIVDKIGAAIISYAVGIVAGNVGRLLGLIPETASGLLDTFSSHLAPGRAEGAPLVRDRDRRGPDRIERRVPRVPRSDRT
jgi:hypothetical protein